MHIRIVPSRVHGKKTCETLPELPKHREKRSSFDRKKGKSTTFVMKKGLLESFVKRTIHP